MSFVAGVFRETETMQPKTQKIVVRLTDRDTKAISPPCSCCCFFLQKLGSVLAKEMEDNRNKAPTPFTPTHLILELDRLDDTQLMS